MSVIPVFKLLWFLFHSSAADTSRHGWSCAITYFEGIGRNTVVFRSAAMLQLASQTWCLLFELFMRIQICGILIGWGCPSDWQSGSLYRACSYCMVSRHHSFDRTFQSGACGAAPSPLTAFCGKENRKSLNTLLFFSFLMMALMP